MFIVLLRFSSNRAAASDFMAAHNEWIQRGVDDGEFALVGSLLPQQGGVVLVRGDSMEVVQARVSQDPFVIHDVVRAEILQVNVARLDERLHSLVELPEVKP